MTTTVSLSPDLIDRIAANGAAWLVVGASTEVAERYGALATVSLGDSPIVAKGPCIALTIAGSDASYLRDRLGSGLHFAAIHDTFRSALAAAIDLIP
jgi:hypothetical protein